MKRIIFSLVLLLALCLPSLADTAPLQLVFASGVPSQASAVRVVITDSAGTVLQAATNTPGGNAFAESSVIPGEYYAADTVTYTAANLPLRAEFYLGGSSPLVSGVTLYLSERGASASAGYTATRAAKLDNADVATSSRQPSGNVTVGGYASGQDPATLVLAANVFSGYTLLKVYQDMWSGISGPSTATYPTSSTQTTHYYQPNGTSGQYSTELVTNGSGKPTSRTYTSP